MTINRNIIYPHNLDVRLELEKAWNLAASDRLTWAELEKLGEWIDEQVSAFKMEHIHDD